MAGVQCRFCGVTSTSESGRKRRFVGATAAKFRAGTFLPTVLTTPWACYKCACQNARHATQGEPEEEPIEEEPVEEELMEEEVEEVH